MKTSIFIDGFNLYYGAVKGTQYRWLDVKALCIHVLPAKAKIEKIKYFTARVSGAADRDAPRRQQLYLRALGTIPEVEIHYGRFLSKTIWRPITNLPVANETIGTVPPTTLPAGNFGVTGANAQTLPVGTYANIAGAAPRRRNRGPVRPLQDALITEVHSMEEKGSDVNLAAHLLNDAWKGDFDAAAVISNDTDLIEPIRMVAQERNKPVYLICPGKWQAAPGLVSVSTHVRHIRRSMLASSQFPDPIPGTTIIKPQNW